MDETEKRGRTRVRKARKTISCLAAYSLLQCCVQLVAMITSRAAYATDQFYRLHMSGESLIWYACVGLGGFLTYLAGRSFYRLLQKRWAAVLLALASLLLAVVWTVLLMPLVKLV